MVTSLRVAPEDRLMGISAVRYPELSSGRISHVPFFLTTMARFELRWKYAGMDAWVERQRHQPRINNFIEISVDLLQLITAQLVIIKQMDTGFIETWNQFFIEEMQCIPATTQAKLYASPPKRRAGSPSGKMSMILASTCLRMPDTRSMKNSSMFEPEDGKVL